LFHSSRNGSNASASSSSGGSRYKRHLISRPYSPAALSVEAKNQMNHSVPSTNGHYFYKDNTSPKLIPVSMTEMSKLNVDWSPITTEPTIESPITPLNHVKHNCVFEVGF
jgi:hypothetical protein